jgi:ubiquinone/menaquinone biosynthesis C-methylase UbiE
MGFFTLDLARMVAPKGRVVALDVQPKMLEVLKRRAQRAGVLDRIELRLITADGLGIKDMNGKVDFFLAFAMVHEVPDPRKFFEEAFASLKKGGRLLFSEPSGHIDAEQFSRELDMATALGLRVESRPKIHMSRSALLVKG